MSDRQEIFKKIMNDKGWGESHSMSGLDSTLAQNEIIRRRIPELLRDLQLKRLLDIPYGYFNWIGLLAPEMESIVDSYIGGDIVPELIQANRARYGGSIITFQVLDLCSDPLPAADVVLVRDCFIHLPFKSIVDALENIQRAGIRYLLASSYTAPRPNVDVPGISVAGRAINLEAHP